MADNKVSSTENLYLADLHCDSVIQMRRGYDLAQRNEDYQVDIPRLREGGVGLQVFACALNAREIESDPFAAADGLLDVLHAAIDKNSDSLGLCCNLADSKRLRAEGRIAALLALEGGYPLESDPERLEHFYKRGVRLITLSHQRPTGWCTSWNQPGEPSEGLTELGRQMIAEMNRLAIIVDISHSSRNTFWKVVEASSKPIIASHSCADKLSPTERNLDDEQIKAIAEVGGVIGVTFIHFTLRPDFLERFNAFWSEHKEAGDEIVELYGSAMPEAEKLQRWAKHRELLNEHDRAVADVVPTLSQVADHLDYIVNLAGVEHVAFGSDFDGVLPLPRGLEDCSKYPNLVAELRHRGYSESDLQKICSENFLRVLREVRG
ncbi:MAG: dipeptidase [bacterium]